MSNSAQPHRRQSTRLPCPWDSPGKNTGVGCHFLLQCMKVKSESEVAQLCPTLSDPMDCSLPGSSIHGTFQARVLEWGAIAFSGGIVRDNEINSLHPISDDLITGLLFQGILGEVLHAELVPSCSHTPVTSSLPHMPALSFPVLLGKCWLQWIPEPYPASRAQNATSLASSAAGENATHVSVNPGYTEPSAFLSFLQGWSYKLFA